MSSFEDRQKGYERKFVHDQEIAFRVAARRNKLLGVWAAQKQGKPLDEAERYGANLAATVIEDRRKDIPGRVLFDLQKAGVTATLKEVREEYERLQQIATEQIMGEAGKA